MTLNTIGDLQAAPVLLWQSPGKARRWSTPGTPVIASTRSIGYRQRDREDHANQRCLPRAKLRREALRKMMLIMPSASAPSVAGWGRMCKSAERAVSMRRGSTTTTYVPLCWASRRNGTKCGLVLKPDCGPRSKRACWRRHRACRAPNTPQRSLRPRFAPLHHRSSVRAHSRPCDSEREAATMFSTTPRVPL